jgi:prepilin-type N-terminal cleavage/methylation domain-containing protein
MRQVPPRSRVSPGRAGFTLIELLIVLGIIALLVSITLVVGGQVMNSGKKTLTQDTLRVLDTSLEAYVKSNETNPDPWAPKLDLLPSGPQTDANVRFPAADARDAANGMMINSVGVYLVQASKVPAAKVAAGAIPSKLVTQLDAYGQPGTTQNTFTTVLDAWGKPIRYVHPAFQGTITGDATAANSQPTQPRATDQILGSLPATTPAQSYAIPNLRRNHIQTSPVPTNPQDWPDSDGGTCVGGRPYFYSAGPDGLVGFIQPQGTSTPVDCNQDNVYTTKPSLPTK